MCNYIYVYSSLLYLYINKHNIKYKLNVNQSICNLLSIILIIYLYKDINILDMHFFFIAAFLTYTIHTNIGVTWLGSSQFMLLCTKKQC